jgi:hypothetical protein
MEVEITDWLYNFLADIFMHLFMIYIGGKHQNSLIELHDIRFIAAESIQSTYPELRNSWWGVPSSLHLDCYGILKQVDGYDIHLKTLPAPSDEKLYFVNLGGYDASEFTELHRNFCIVAKNVMEAQGKAKKQIAHWESPHKDYSYQIDDVLNVQNAISSQGLYIHLERSQNLIPFDFVAKYVPISV